MRPIVLAVALLAALACGGSDNPDPTCEPIACGDSCGSVPDGCGGTLSCGECFVPPTVDPTRLGVACPAPEVLITINEYGETVPAGDLVAGDQVYSLPWLSLLPRRFDVLEATRLSGQQRLRLVLTDGRAPIFTADHALNVDPQCSTVDLPESLSGVGGWVELQYVRPGWCLRGQIAGITERVENAPDGDVILISVGVNGPDGDYWNNRGAYWADGLWSIAHNAGYTPPPPN